MEDLDKFRQLILALEIIRDHCQDWKMGVSYALLGMPMEIV